MLKLDDPIVSFGLTQENSDSLGELTFVTYSIYNIRCVPKKKKLTITTNKLDERKERQRQWAISHKFKIRDSLLTLGRTFDSKPKDFDKVVSD